MCGQVVVDRLKFCPVGDDVRVCGGAGSAPRERGGCYVVRGERTVVCCRFGVECGDLGFGVGCCRDIYGFRLFGKPGCVQAEGGCELLLQLLGLGDLGLLCGYLHLVVCHFHLVGSEIVPPADGCGKVGEFVFGAAGRILEDVGVWGCGGG